MPKKGECRYCKALSVIHDVESIVEYTTDGLKIGGKKPTDAQLKELIGQCLFLERSELWKLLSSTLKAQAIKTGLIESKDFDQVIFAKASLHSVDVQQSIINAIRLENKNREGVAKTTKSN